MRTRTWVAALAAGMLFSWVAGPASSADVEVDVKVNRAKKNTQTEKQKELSKGPLYKSSTLIGMEVKNSQGEDLGEINDLVVDLHQGNVRYAALSFGGFLGLGDKLFAVPWQAMAISRTEDPHFVLNVEKETLKNAPGFNKDQWPNVADRKWIESIDAYYKDVPSRAEDSAVRAERKEKTKTAATDKELPYTSILKASSIAGLNVRNEAGEELGEINELVIDPQSGKIRYAALSFGGFLGLGDKLFAIPWQAMAFQHNEDGKFVVLNVSKERLKNAPGFDKDQWPNTASPQWRESIDTFYGEKLSQK